LAAPSGINALPVLDEGRVSSVCVQEFRSSGVQEFRSSGVQEFRSSGVQEFRSSGWATPSRVKLARANNSSNGLALKFCNS